MKRRKWIAYPRYIFRKELALSLIRKNVPAGSKFLEVGCASGDFGITLAGMGYRGLMIDFSDEAADETTKNLKEKKVTNVRFENKDLRGIGVEGKFDLVTLFEVLEHIEDDKAFLYKINELLKTGGKLLCSVPSRQKLWGANDVLAGHIRRYEKEDLTKLFEISGFRIIEFFSYGFPWLNMIKYFRDFVARKVLEKQEQGSRVLRTKKSGLNIIAIETPLFGFISNKYFLFLPIHISRLFNRFDLAEGYLCLAHKK